jgi:DNA segregation ATPase FtsK/SpoIIIE-like protein
MDREIRKYLYILPKDGQPQSAAHRAAKKVLKANGIAFEEKETDDIQNLARSMDYLYSEAKKIVKKEEWATPALLQRKLRVGYARAANLLDMLKENGVIASKAKPRK